MFIAAQPQQVCSSDSARNVRTAIQADTPAIMSPATGSAHHQPSTALAESPTRSAADNIVQTLVCAASATAACEPSDNARRRLADARIGITMSDSAAIAMPSVDASGSWRPMRSMGSDRNAQRRRLRFVAADEIDGRHDRYVAGKGDERPCDEAPSAVIGWELTSVASLLVQAPGQHEGGGYLNA